MNGAEKDKSETPKKSGKELEGAKLGICESSGEEQIEIKQISYSSNKDNPIKEGHAQANITKNEIRTLNKPEERQKLKLRLYRHKSSHEKVLTDQQDKQKLQPSTGDNQRNANQERIDKIKTQSGWFIENPSYNPNQMLESEPSTSTMSSNKNHNLIDTPNQETEIHSPVHIYEEIKELLEKEDSEDDPENLNDKSVEHLYESPNKLAQEAESSEQHYEVLDHEKAMHYSRLKVTENKTEQGTKQIKEKNDNQEDLQNTLRRLDEIAKKTGDSHIKDLQKEMASNNTEDEEFVKKSKVTSEGNTRYQRSNKYNVKMERNQDVTENVNEGNIIIKIPIDIQAEKCVRYEICGQTANWACKKCKKLVCSKFCLYKTRCEPLSEEQIEAGGLICSCGNTLHNVEILEHALSKRVWVASIGSTNIYTNQTMHEEREQKDKTQNSQKKVRKPKKINMLRAHKSTDETYNIDGTGSVTKPVESNVNNTENSTEDELSKLLKEHIGLGNVGETLPASKVELGYPEDKYCHPQPIPKEYGSDGEELNLVAYFEGKRILWPATNREEDEFRQRMWKNQGPPKHAGWTWKWEHENQETNAQIDYIFWEDALVSNNYPTLEGNWVHRQNQYFWHSTPIIREGRDSYEVNKKVRSTIKMPNSGPERYEGITPRRDVPKLRERQLGSFYNLKGNSNLENSDTRNQKYEFNDLSTRKLESKIKENLPKHADSYKTYQNRMKRMKRYRKDKQRYKSSTEASEDEDIGKLLKSIIGPNKANKNRNINTEPESDSGEEEEDDIPPNLTKALNRLKPFSGKANDPKALRDFLNELQAIFSVYLPKDIQKNPLLADKIKAKALQVSLTENALGYFASLSPQDKKSYKKAKSLLKTRFIEPTTSIYIFQKLTELQQGGLTILALKEKIEDLVNRYIEEDQGLKNATSEVRNEVKKFLEIHNFRQALRKDIHDEIIKGNKIANQSFDSLVERALEIEGAQRIIRARDSFGKVNRTQRLMNVQEEATKRETPRMPPRSTTPRINNSYLERTTNRPLNRPQYGMNNFPKPGQIPPRFYNGGFPRVNTETNRFWTQNHGPSDFPNRRQLNFRPNRPEVRTANAPWWRQNDHIRARQQAWQVPNRLQYQNSNRYSTYHPTGQSGQQQSRWPRENSQEKTL